MTYDGDYPKFKKFFNLGEPLSIEELPDELPVITEKLDGRIAEDLMMAAENTVAPNEEAVHETRKPNMIRVEYDGDYPTTCMGTLKIYDDDELIYNEMYCCTSTGSAYIDDDGDDHVTEGELLWNEEEASEFSPEIQRMVKDVLSGFHVCCGGCL